MASFLVPFMGSAINLALPEMGKAFSLNAVQLALLAAIYLISTAIFQIPAARMGDLVGRRKIFVWGVLLFSICTLLCGCSVSGAMLFLMRFLSGVGSAMLFGTSMAILSSIFSAKNRGRALGINVATVYFSLAAGPFLGGMLTDWFGWRSIFIFCAGVGFTVALLSRWFLNAEWIESKGTPFDYVGSAVYGIGLFGLIYGFTQLPAMHGWVWLISGLGLLIYFVHYERKITAPVFDVNLFFTNRLFSLSSLAALINYAATSAVAFMLSLYLRNVRGYSARDAGLILISQAIVQAVFSLIFGRLSDRVAPHRLATAGMLVIVAGLIGLIFISVDMSMIWLIFYLICLGMGFGIFSSPNTNVVMSSVDSRHYGQASATLGTMRLTGQAFSMGIAGMAIALHVGDQSITPAIFPEFLLSIRHTFFVFALLCLVGVYASAQRRSRVEVEKAV